jgi:hypothetical protein
VSTVTRVTPPETPGNPCDPRRRETMDTDGNALESARNTGYHQMADHDQPTLIERL